MSQPLKQSSIASGAFGLYLLHEFMCHSRENKERVRWFCLRLQVQAKQVLDEELLTDADLNISEDEAYTPVRREGSSRESMRKTFGLQTEECDMYSSSWWKKHLKPANQPPCCIVNKLYKQNRLCGWLLFFFFFSLSPFLTTRILYIYIWMWFPVT